MSLSRDEIKMLILAWESAHQPSSARMTMNYTWLAPVPIKRKSAEYTLKVAQGLAAPMPFSR